MKRIRYLSIGVISEGTLKTDDLLSEAAWTLEQCCKRNKSVRGIDLRTKQRLIKRAHVILGTWDEEDFEDTSDASNLLDEIIAALDDFAPPFCSVGFHEGDGACFGCFISHDSIEMALQDREITQINDWNEANDPGQYLFVNDHGNMSLYTKFANHKTREEWAIV